MLELLGGTGHRHLFGSQEQQAHAFFHLPRADPVVGEIPRCATGLLEPARCFGGAGLRDFEDPLAVAFDGGDEAFVTEELQRRIDRAWAGTGRASGTARSIAGLAWPVAVLAAVEVAGIRVRGAASGGPTPGK